MENLSNSRSTCTFPNKQARASHSRFFGSLVCSIVAIVLGLSSYVGRAHMLVIMTVDQSGGMLLIFEFEDKVPMH